MGLFGNIFDTSSPDKKVEKTAALVRETGAAVNPATIGNLSLQKKSEAAGNALARKNLHGVRSEALLLLDFSGSMYGDYQSGAVQTLVERFLAFALQIDADGKIPVIPFASRRLNTIDVTLQNYQGIVERELVNKQQMGSTNLAHALEEVLNIARTTDSPLFVGVVTDGNPDSEEETTKLVCRLANYPVFIKFLALRSVSYLEELDNLDSSYRLVDNVNSQFFPNLSITDEQFADAMTEEWDVWVDAATRAGLLHN
jgi:uncharacterized protein with von Willebrand factor type A (vWA) domain